MTNRIGGPGPSEPTRGRTGQPEPDSDKFKEKMKKVEKIKEVEESELDKQKKRAFYTVPDENGELASTSTRSPSPFERDFMKPSPPKSSASSSKSMRGFEDLSTEAIPAPPTSPPPQINTASTSKIDLDSGHDLPQSESFWKDFDLPDQPLPQRTFQEQQPTPQNRTKTSEEIEPQKRSSPTQPKESEKEENQPDEKKKKKDEPPLTASPQSKDEKPLAAPQAKKKKEGLEEELTDLAKSSQAGKKSEKLTTPSKKEDAAFMIPEEDQLEEPRSPALGEGEEKIASALPPLPAKMEKEKKDSKTPSALEKQDSQSLETPQATSFEKSKDKEDQGAAFSPPDDLVKKPGEEEKTKTESVASITIPDPLPHALQQTVQSLTPPPPSYVNAQTAAIEGLFRQMVGSILYFAQGTSGISSTEVLLNSPSMQNSPFFNARILIEKYASAPDSFNIRLTGTPQAVKIFNDNLHGLTSAFTAAYEDRRIQFRIGRLETSIAPEKHLIRRKKEAGSQEDAGGELER